MSTMTDDEARAAEVEEATAEVCQAQERAERAAGALADLKEQVAEARDDLKDAEALYRSAGRRLRMLRAGLNPDPGKYPLIDGPEAEEEDDE